MIYQFDSCSLDVARRELRRDGAPVALEPQVFDLLLFLIQARDRVVSRDDLLSVVWNGRIVSDATLSSRVNAARNAVGDNGAAQRLIRTLPRKGFRFVAEVREDVEAASGPGPAATASGGRRTSDRAPSVAVLPFANLDADPGDDFFAEGIADEIITALSRVSGLFVIARGSSFSLKDASADIRHAGAELGVDYVLEGSVRRAAGRLRIAGRLVDAANGACLWADRFEGDAVDVFALQDEVAERVAAAIEPTLEVAEIARRRRDPPPRLDSYDLLLQARAHIARFTAADMRVALERLERALTLDPAYAPAMAAAAYCLAQCHFQGWEQPAAGRGEAVARAWRAVELAPNDAQVLWMAAFAIWNMADDGRDRARALFERSLEINPNSAMALTLAGWIDTMCGDVALGRTRVSRARQLSPRDPRGWLMSGAMAIAAVLEADYLQALSWADHALMQNRRFAVALRVAAVASVKLHRSEQAKSLVRELLHIEPELTISGFFARIPVPVEGMRHAYAEALAEAGLPP